MTKEEIIKAFEKGIITKCRMERLLLALKIKESKGTNKEKAKQNNVCLRTLYRLKKL